MSKCFTVLSLSLLLIVSSCGGGGSSKTLTVPVTPPSSEVPGVVLQIESEVSVGQSSELVLYVPENEEGMLTVFAPHTESFKAKQALAESFGEIDYDVDEIQFIAQNTAPLAGEDVDVFATFMDMLEDLDDVQNVFHNVA